MTNEQNIQPVVALPTLAGVTNVYFIGIGGIGMSALARYFQAKCATVAGYDKTETPLTKALQQEGIHIHYNEAVADIPKDANLVVYTPAVPAAHAELNFYKDHNYTVVKRSDVLGAITKETY
ncbi:MAG TPA: Mur ligase domain-containing protein, partial [Chitinophagaceae bacterium]|nr:Mur ligase domain-containing protein [Chitinophagaceae bacterium]